MKNKFLKNITPRDYQEKIFKTCKDKNCLVVLPTGIGKTLIALMLAIERMEKFPTKKIVFLAPTKPLAEQHLSYFKKYLPELFAEMELFTGAVIAQKRKKIWQTSDIIFSTPQCIANDLKKNLYDLTEVSLLIEDEAHRCTKNYDYNYIARVYNRQAKEKRILALTASPGSDSKKIKEICDNLFIESVEVRTRDSEDVKEYLQELDFEKILVEFPKEFEEIRQVILVLYNQYIEELKKRKILFGQINKTRLLQLQKEISSSLARGNRNFNYMLGASACAQAIKLQHALELLETQTLASFNKYLKNLFSQASKKQSKGVVKLVKKPEFNFIFMSSNELLTKESEHPKLEKLGEIIQEEFVNHKNKVKEKKGADLINSVQLLGGRKGDGGGLSNLKEKGAKQKTPKIIIFTQFRDTAKTISQKLNKINGVMAKVFVGQLKKDGMGLTQKEQKKVIEEFSSGKINILVATSIAEEGLDIPEVNSVIFYEPIPSAIRAIQRAGRTARLMKGKLIVLITKNTRDEAYYYVSRSREKKMHRVISAIKNDLENGKLKKKKEFQKKLK